jgi:hypothetical protein
MTPATAISPEDVPLADGDIDVDTLAREGRLLSTLDGLWEQNRLHPDPVVEQWMLQIRMAALDELDAAPDGTSWPHQVDDRFADAHGIPEIGPSELDTELVASGILHHGALIVRGLLDAAQIERLRECIDRAMEGHDALGDKAPTSSAAPWYVPWRPEGSGEELTATRLGRRWVRSGGGAWLADSPRAAFEVLDTYDRVGLREVIETYLGERPALSVQKSTLRRVPLDLNGADWHQDGAFLGSGIRTINVWLALTDCGTVAPGLDIVPRRIDTILETGTRGAWFEWSVGQELVDQVSSGAGAPVVRPEFSAGDVLLFDEMNLHRTALEPTMTVERYAIETWFFAPSCYPDGQTPIVC